MSDLELVGMRDDATGKLHIASVLGTLGTVFAVVIYRNDPGLRCVYEIVSTRSQPESRDMFEGLDYLKIEWCRKGELRKPDLQTLSDAAYKPKGRGAIWPRFESCQPGWHPWGMSDAEARLMTELLAKVGRFVYLRERSGPLYREPIEANIPIISAGEETTLRLEEIEWLPLIPVPAPVPEPFALPRVDCDILRKLPVREDFVVEMISALVPELSFVDEVAGRPCLARIGFMVDCGRQQILCGRIVHGAAPLREAAGPALVEVLRNAKARPALIRVDDERLAGVLRPACAELDVRLSLAPLEFAPLAWEDFELHFQSRARR